MVEIPEQMAIDIGGIGNGVGPEEHKGKADKKYRASHADEIKNGIGDGVFALAKGGFQSFSYRGGDVSHHHIDPMEGAPKNIGPVGPVPKAADQKGQKQVAILPQFAFSVSAQGDIDIIHKPAGKGDVPVAPIIAHRIRQIGPFEVLHQRKAQNPGTAHGNVGIAAEITVNLNGKKYGGQHQRKSLKIVAGIIDRIHRNGQSVGNDYLFKEAPKHHPQPFCRLFQRKAVFFIKLGQQIFAPLDGPGH